MFHSLGGVHGSHRHPNHPGKNGTEGSVSVISSLPSPQHSTGATDVLVMAAEFLQFLVALCLDEVDLGEHLLLPAASMGRFSRVHPEHC